MDLVVLAAGMGRRFGGVKQLAPVGADGEAIIDVIATRAARAGFTRMIVVVRAEIEAAVAGHLDTRGGVLPAELVVQQPVVGTAHAVLAARPALTGPFAVVNADDCYPFDAFSSLAAALRERDDRAHVLVAFRLGCTLLGPRPVSRAFCDVDAHGWLTAIREETVAAGDPRRDALVSMNMWGFRLPMLDNLARAVDTYAATGAPGEVRLPDVVDASLAHGLRVRVVPCEERCTGVTYADDLPAVRAALTSE